MLAAFPKRAADYLPAHRMPHKYRADSLEWLSILQHYGAPTRLLDCTRSPYVALFFAIETPPDDVRAAPPAIWTFDSGRLREAVFAAVRDDRLTLDDDNDQPVSMSYAVRLAATREDILAHHIIHAYPATPVVALLEPQQFDARQAAQQAMFLCQGDLSLSFAENLRRSGVDMNATVERITFPWSCRPALLAELRRMSVTSETLFPGLDGYARSFRTKFVEPLP